MSDGIIVASAFIVSFFFHVVLYRLFNRHKVSSMFSVFSYGIGLLIFIGATATERLLYPITSLIVYCSAAICTSWLSFGSFLGKAPSSMMFAAYEKHPALTKRQLFRLLVPEDLIVKRVNDLYRSKLVNKRKKMVILTPKGKSIAVFINCYQLLFNRKERG
jgi:hypothetical protein